MSHLLPNSVKCSPLLFQRSCGGNVKVTKTAIELWAPYVQDSSSKFEAGGVLLGRRILDTNDIIVDIVTTPMPNDRRKRFQFFRSKTGHQERIKQAWQDSSGATNYLGEWHTHPEDTPRPSCVDRWDWKSLVKAVDFEGDELFFFIVGIEHIRAWEVARASRKISPLRSSAPLTP